MLCILLCQLVLGLEYNSSYGPYFYAPEFGKHEQLKLDLLETEQAVILWSMEGLTEDIEIRAQTQIANGSVYNVSFHTGFGVRVRGISSTLKFAESVKKLQVWFIPDSYCTGPLIAYSMPNFVSDDLIVEEDTANLCIFLSHYPAQMSTNVRSNRPIMKAYTQDNVIHQTTATESSKAMFFIADKLESHDQVSVDIYLDNDQGRVTCEREYLSIIDGWKITLKHLKVKTQHLTCSRLEHMGSVHILFILVAAVFATLVAITLMVFCGCCDRFRAKVRALIDGKPLPVERTEILMQDEDRNLLIEAPEEEEEEVQDL